MQGEDWDTAVAVLRLAGQLTDAIQDGVTSRGFTDVRPAHGFAFVRISAGDATTADVAEYLGITKQAASQLVEQLVTRGYLTRVPDPSDGRARLLLLTDRGQACTAAARDAATDAIDSWRARLGARDITTLDRTLTALLTPGPLRPTW